MKLVYNGPYEGVKAKLKSGGFLEVKREVPFEANEVDAAGLILSGQFSEVKPEPKKETAKPAQEPKKEAPKKASKK